MHSTTADSDFSKGSVRGNILRLAGPMTLAQLINLLYNILTGCTSAICRKIPPRR